MDDQDPTPAKRKAINDQDARNVKPKPLTEIEITQQDEEAYDTLAFIPPDRESFKKAAREILSRSGPERRFQDTMLEDMLRRAIGRGLDESRAQAVRQALGLQLRLHLTQKFTEGIGRISPDTKHLRNTLVTIIRAYDQANPGELPADMGKNVHKLFSPGTQRLHSPASMSMASPGQGRAQLQKTRENSAAPNGPPQDTNPTLDGSKELKTTTEPAPTPQMQSQSQSLMTLPKVPTAPMLTENQTPPGTGNKETKTRAGEAENLQTEKPFVADDTTLSQPSQAEQTNNGLTAGSGAEDATTSELAQAGSSHDVAANGDRSKLEPEAPLSKHDNSTTRERASSTNMSENIDALIKEYKPTQAIKGHADRASSREGRLSPISASSTSGQEVLKKNHSINGNSTGHEVSTGDVYQRTVSGTSSSLRIVKRPSHPYDQTPTNEINPKHITCYYWYYRKPPCQLPEHVCHFAHDIKTHVASRSKTDPPVRVDTNIARKRMADLGLLKESSQTPKPKASEIMPSKGNADKSFIKPDAIVKREVETDSHISLPPISNTPIIDSLWGANRPTEPSQREALLAKVKSNLLNRGHPDDLVTNVTDDKGRHKDLSPIKHAGLESKMFGLFNTFNADPARIRISLEDLLRPLVQANPDKFREIPSQVFEGSTRPPSAPRTPSGPSSSRHVAIDSYRPHARDVGSDLRGTRVASDYHYPEYESWAPREAEFGHSSRGERLSTAYNHPSMTCPYWLRYYKGGNPCARGDDCKFTHGITEYVAGEAGKGRPKPLGPDGTILGRY